MSQIAVTIERVLEIKAHPNADKLEIALILGTQTIVPKGQFHAGQHAAFFPPEILLPPTVAIKLGVQKYLKFALLNGVRQQCRVAACRLRGTPSYGFIIPVSPELGGEHADVSYCYCATKYEPPASIVQGDTIPDIVAFHQYTEIENYYRYPDAIPEGTPVRITEKRHGTNCRVGLIRVDNERQFVAGSHKTVRQQPSLYSRPLEDDRVLTLLTCLCNEKHNVIIFCEIFGPGIQDMHYGLTEPTFEVFDISIDGCYLDWDDVERVTRNNGVETVPLLRKIRFQHAKVDDWTNGPTYSANVRGFQGREGIVITPLVEAHSEVLNGRMILKSVSADYLDRKGARDD